MTKKERLDCINRLYEEGKISSRKRDTLEYIQEFNEPIIKKYNN